MNLTCNCVTRGSTNIVFVAVLSFTDAIIVRQGCNTNSHNTWVPGMEPALPQMQTSYMKHGRHMSLISEIWWRWINIPHSVIFRALWVLGATVQRRCVHSWRRWSKISSRVMSFPLKCFSKWKGLWVQRGWYRWHNRTSYCFYIDIRL